MIDFQTADPRFDPKGSVRVNGYLFTAASDIKPRARRADPDASHHAANFIAPALREIQLQVLTWAQRRADAYEGGMFTDMELLKAFGGGSTYRTRRAELVQMGLMQDSGARISVPGHKCKFTLWELTPSGQAYGRVVVQS